MRILRFWAFVFAALACVSLGVEAERYLSSERPSVAAPLPPVSTKPGPTSKRITNAMSSRPDLFTRVMEWEPLSTRALWSQVAPGSLGWVESLGRQEVHTGVWENGVETIFAWPPALWLGALSLVTFLLARLRMGNSVPDPGGMRSVFRWLGLGLAAAGFALIGADLFRAAGAWQPRPVVDLWGALHAASLDAWGRQGWLSATLDWPAWLTLAVLGIVLAFLARPRRELQTYAYGPGSEVVPVRWVDLSRTLAYLESMRSWPPRKRRGARAEAADLRDFE